MNKRELDRQFPRLSLIQYGKQIWLVGDSDTSESISSSSIYCPGQFALKQKFPHKEERSANGHNQMTPPVQDGLYKNESFIQMYC